MKSILLVKKLSGLVEMMSGLVSASFSLPEWQTVKMIFFAPWASCIFINLCQVQLLKSDVKLSQAHYSNTRPIKSQVFSRLP